MDWLLLIWCIEIFTINWQIYVLNNAERYNILNKYFNKREKLYFPFSVGYIPAEDTEKENLGKMCYNNNNNNNYYYYYYYYYYY